MERFLWVCLAGAMGTGVRYWVNIWAGQRFGTEFPYGTLIVNILGCFLIGLVLHLAGRIADFPANLRFAVTTGFLGGLTTYSSFNYETTRFVQVGAPNAAAANFAVTTVLCFAAGWLGVLVASHWVGG